MEFGKRLAQIRKEKKLSQGELAKMVDIHANVLGRYERSEARPFVEMAAKLADALEVSLDYLVGNSDLKFDKETINRIVDIQNLSDEDKHPLLKLVDAYLRDVKTKRAYVG
jgi:transcriptional regulator with XRE-family HTH domain